MSEQDTDIMEYTLTLLEKVFANEKEKYERFEQKIDNLISLTSNNYELQQKIVEMLSRLDEIERKISEISYSKTIPENKNRQKRNKIINLKDFIELIQKNKVKPEHLEVILTVKNAGENGITRKRIDGEVKIKNKTVYTVLNRYDFIEQYEDSYPKIGRPPVLYKITDEDAIKVLENIN